MAGKWVDVTGGLYFGSAFNVEPAEFDNRLNSITILREGQTLYDVLTFATGDAARIGSSAGRVIRAVQANWRFVTEYTAQQITGGLDPSIVNGSPDGAFARMRLPCIFHSDGVSETYAPAIVNGERAAAAWDWQDPTVREYLGRWTGAAVQQLVIPDRTVPIGYLGPDANQRTAQTWGGGLVSVQFSRVGGAIATFGQIRYLLSPRPTWHLRAPNQWNWRVGQTQTLEVEALYPDGEKIVGLPLRVTTPSGCFDFRPLGSTGPYSRSVVVETSPDGVARVQVRAVSPGEATYTVAPVEPRMRAVFQPELQGGGSLTVIEGADLGADCYVVPEQPAVPGIPARVEVVPQYGWDSGANSIDTIAGDAVVRFTMGRVIGAIVGFTTTRVNVTDRARLSHALYCYLEQGQSRVAVMESGQLRTAGVLYSPNDLLRIERAGDRVTYYRADQVLYRSRVPSVGVLSVGSMLYATGDSIE